MTNPAWPDSLFVAETGSSSPRIWRFTWEPDPDGVDGPEEASLVPAAQRRSHYSSRFAFLPGGQELVTAQGDVLSADTLDQVARYQDIDRPSAAGVAAGADGTVGFTSNRTDRTVTTYAPGRREPWHRYDFSNTRDVFARGASLAFSGSTTFVTTDADPYHSDHLHLRAIPTAGPSHLTMRLDHPRYRCGQRARLTVRLTGPTTERSVRLLARTPHGGYVRVGDWELGDSRRGVFRFRAAQTLVFQAALLDPDDRVVAERRAVVRPRCR